MTFNHHFDYSWLLSELGVCGTKFNMASFLPDKLSFSGQEGEDFNKFLCKVELYCAAFGLSEKNEEKCMVSHLGHFNFDNF